LCEDIDNLVYDLSEIRNRILALMYKYNINWYTLFNFYDAEPKDGEMDMKEFDNMLINLGF
jgi:hypothetical protein